MTHEIPDALVPRKGTATLLRMRQGVTWRIGAQSADLVINPETPAEARDYSAKLFVRRTNRRWATGEAWLDEPA